MLANVVWLALSCMLGMAAHIICSDQQQLMPTG